MTSAVPQIITSEKFKYYKNVGKVVSSKEIHLQQQLEEKERNNMILESMKRQSKMNKIDSKRINTNNDKLNDVLSEARQRSMHILQRASKLKMEQEEEIQKCSRLILEMKCRAVRDAQVSLVNFIYGSTNINGSLKFSYYIIVSL